MSETMPKDCGVTITGTTLHRFKGESPELDYVGTSVCGLQISWLWYWPEAPKCKRCFPPKTP